MIAAEHFLVMTETEPTATATASAGAVSWSLASPTATGAATAPTATPPPSTSSAAAMIVVPGSGMIVVQRYEYTGRELASESNERRAAGPMPDRRSGVRAANVNYFRFRVYGPALGQFFTRDPLGYVDGMGLYAGWFSARGTTDPFGTFAPKPKQWPIAANASDKDCCDEILTHAKTATLGTTVCCNCRLVPCVLRAPRGTESGAHGKLLECLKQHEGIHVPHLDPEQCGKDMGKVWEADQWLEGYSYERSECKALQKEYWCLKESGVTGAANYISDTWTNAGDLKGCRPSTDKQDDWWFADRKAKSE